MRTVVLLCLAWAGAGCCGSEGTACVPPDAGARDDGRGARDGLDQGPDLRPEQCGARTCDDFARSCVWDVLGCFRPTGACTAAISDGLDHRTLASCWSDGSRAYFDGSAYQGYYELRGADGSICAACWWESSGAGSFACVREGRMIYVYPDEPAFPSGYPAPVEVGCFGGAVERYCLADRGLFFSCVPVFPFFGCPRGECAGPAPDGGTPDGHPPSG